MNETMPWNFMQYMQVNAGKPGQMLNLIPDLQGNWMVISGVNSDNSTDSPYFMKGTFNVTQDELVYDYTDRASGFLLDGFNWNSTGYYTQMTFNPYAPTDTQDDNTNWRWYEIDF